MPPQAGQRSLATIDSSPQVVAVDAQDKIVEIGQAGDFMDHGNLAPAVAGYTAIHIRRAPATSWAGRYFCKFKVTHK